MTYIQRKDVTNRIPNKFEAIKIAALEARRLNDRARAVSANLPGKLTTIAVQRLIDGQIIYYDKRERAAAALKERENAQE